MAIVVVLRESWHCQVRMRVGRQLWEMRRPPTLGALVLEAAIGRLAASKSNINWPQGWRAVYCMYVASRRLSALSSICTVSEHSYSIPVGCTCHERLTWSLTEPAEHRH